MQLVKNITARSSKRAPASVSLLAVLLLAGPVTFAACGDDGNVLGSDDGAGRSSAAGTSGSNVAGAGLAGAQDSAGTHSGGANSAGANSAGSHSGGATHSGGAINSAGANNGGGGGTACNIGECLRANVCLDHCGGKVVYTGCCACAANTIEQTACMGGGGSAGQASTDCAGATCSAAQSCVAYRTVGGAMFPVDAHGMCMTGRHPEGNVCEADFSYTCAELTGCSAPSTTCRCAAGTACAQTTVCRLPTASVWLDPSADLLCELQAP